ncbi:hypothetical protein [Kibdelosporangium aridum]|nr:hypothetical protein [Kibdelosporangium aridum]
MMRWLATAVVGLGLAGAGCAPTGQAPPTQASPPPPPPATQQLVRWSDAMCGTAKAIDSARPSAVQFASSTPDATRADAFIREVATWVDGTSKQLQDLKPTGIEPVDSHTSKLRTWFTGLEKKSVDGMKAGEADKVAHAGPLAQEFSTSEPAEAGLSALAERTPELVASYNVAPGCTPVRQAGQDGRERDLVLWANIMCATTKELSTLRTDPLADPAVSDPRFQRAAWASLGTYISSAGSPLSDVSTQLSSVKPIGIAEADAYQAALLSAVQSAMAKLPQGTSSTELFQLPIDQLKAKATEVAGILATAKPKEPGLDAIVAKDEKLKAAHGLAPSCESPQQTPATAANGTDLSACQSGKCQVQITGSADVTAGGHTFKVSVSSAGVTVTDASRVLNLGPGGQGSFGDATKTIAVKLVSLTGNAAIVDITAS